MIPGGRSLERDLGFGIKPSRKGFAGAEGQRGESSGNDPVFPAPLPPGDGGTFPSSGIRGAFPGKAAQLQGSKRGIPPALLQRQMTENKERRHSCSRGGARDPPGIPSAPGKGLGQRPGPGSTSDPAQQHQLGPPGLSGNPGNCKFLSHGNRSLSRDGIPGIPNPIPGIPTPSPAFLPPSLAFLTRSKAFWGMGKLPGFHISCGWVLFIPPLPKNLRSG